MNVLLFTTSMILLLASLTYARLEMYRNLSVLQGEFNHYMELTERSSINNQAENWYQSSVAQKSDKAGERKEKAQGLSRLSFAVFVDSEVQEEHKEEYPELLELAKKLLFVLYKDQSFYQELKQKRPDLEDGLIKSLKLAEELPKGQKITRAADLANLNLQDADLNDIFYKMLQGTQVPKNDSQKTFKNGEPSQCDTEVAGEEGEDSTQADLTESRSAEGSYSLLDYITLQDSSQLRVYLASKPLLLAIFDDPAIVQNILEARCNFFRSVSNNSLTAEQATEAFRSQFLSHSKGFEKILDFTVSKTNPKNYE